MATSLNQPQAISQPFAQNGDKNVIPVTNDGTTGAASESLGFPQITSVPVAQGGIPPARKDFNGIFNVLSNQYFYLQNGGSFTFNQDVSDAIGGYPVDAILQYTDTVNNMSYQVRSLIPNNTYNFVTTPSYIDGEHWTKAFSEDLSDYVHKTGSNTISADNTFSGTNTFSGSTSLSTNTTGVTQATNDASTKIATTQFVQNVAVTKANKDMDNLTSTGQNIANWSTNVTNCITEIPQDIKLELNNGTLTLKAGSKVYVPNGTGVFDEVTIASDKTYSTSQNGQCFITYLSSGSLGKFIGSASGTTQPTGTDLLGWYDTTNNTIKRYISSSSSWDNGGNSLPIAIVTVSDGAISRIDQVFNGFGYIGQSKFMLPNVKALLSNGRNEDGTLKNFEFTNNTVQVVTSGGTYNRRMFIWNGELHITVNAYTYNSVENLWYDQNGIKITGNGVCYVGDCFSVNDVITTFTVKTPFHAVDYNDFAPVKAQVDTNTTALTTKANVGLDNLNADGQMIVDSQNGAISNCILEIPQNIKLTLENNTLTLKAGSVLVNGGSTYSTYTITSDSTVTAPNVANAEYMIFEYGTNNFAGALLDNIVSGSTDSKSGVPYHVWFDTDNKIINRYGSDGTTAVQCRYPICIAKTTSAGGSWDSFAKDSNGNDMIFNGAGFIGHHAFVYPNVKGLFANGFDEERKLESSELNSSSLMIIELNRDQSYVEFFSNTLLATRYYVGEFDNESELPNVTSNWYTAYVKNENATYYKRQTDAWIKQTGRNLNLITYNYDGTTITDFTIRQPVRLATTEMLDKKQDTLTFDTTPTQNSINPVTSGGVYTALGGKANSSMFQVVASLPATPDPDTFYFIPE